MRGSALREILQAVRAGLAPGGPVILAVSGGMDSMVLLDAAAESIDRGRLRVATFDHGSGTAATDAAALVAREGQARGIEVIVGRADTVSSTPTEAAWRLARWRFLRAVANDAGGTIATAHTRDDQVETVLLRALRGAGARGLAGLAARSDIARPLLGVSRSAIERYAAERGISWLNDPSNQSRAFSRNRARLDLLPALRRVRPSIDAMLLDVGVEAAAWRSEVESLVDRAFPSGLVPGKGEGGGLDVPAEPLRDFARGSLEIVWPVIAARVGLTLDRRGTQRLVEATISGRRGSRIQLSGGWTLYRARDRFQLRRETSPGITDASRNGWLRVGDSLLWKGWHLHPAEGWSEGDPWTAWLPAGQSFVVREWRPGDRMTLMAGGKARRVKRYLSDAGISGNSRPLWPVLVSGKEVAWIPGVRRSHLAAEQPGNRGLAYKCDYRDL